ncbi:MAG: efflux RND transporter periplasmic adaptor subunit [Bryobacterales bacterium]|nr:efflux RND transporter periplasmic adaptor subunit [Bryobacterales bacterium]
MQKKKIALILTATACIPVGLGMWVAVGGRDQTRYRTATAGHGDVNVTVSATGNPNAVVTVQVGSQVSGIIQALFADFNSKVTKGELIARIDPAPFQAKVDQARATLDAARAAVVNSEAVVQQALANIQAANSSLAAAKANVLKAEAIAEDARVKVERRVIMVGQGADSKEDLETAQTTYKSAVADHNALAAQQQAVEDSVKAAQAQLSVANSLLAANRAQVKQFTAGLQSAQLDLDHTRILAPVDGVVVSRNVDVGQTVAASLAAPTLFLIAQDLTKMQVDTNVSEADIGRVSLGQPAAFTVDAYPGRTFTGKVISIRRAPINVQNVVTYDAVIGVSNPDLKLFPGMTANVKILVNKRVNVLRIPNAALRFHPASEPPVYGGGQGERAGAVPPQAVWILDQEGRPRRVALVTGESDGTYCEVVKGELKDGDHVILAALAGAAAPAGGSPGSFQSGARGGRGPRF